MQSYNFEAIHAGRRIAKLPSAELSSLHLAWPRVAQLAAMIDKPGSRIRVTNDNGEIVVLIGAAAARKLFRL